MDNKIVSIIIPAHNAEGYILRSVLSAVKQTYVNVEIIVVNDGSSDKTGEIVNSVSDDRVKLITIESSGVSRARNVGLDASCGDYIVFLDADDALTHDAVEFMVGRMEETNVDICICWQNRLTVDEAPFETSSGNGKERFIDGEKAVEFAIDCRRVVNSCLANMYKRELIGDTRFIEGRNINEDVYFNFLCFCKKPTLLIKHSKVYNYFETPNSLSRSEFSEKHLDILYYAEKKEETIRKSFPEYVDRIPSLHIKARMLLLQNLCKSYNRKHRVYEKECIRYIIKNRKKFSSVYASEKRFFKIITFRLYWAQKLMHNLKKKFKKL